MFRGPFHSPLMKARRKLKDELKAVSPGELKYPGGI